MSTTSPGFLGFPSVTAAVRVSNDAWAADLRLLFEHAHERFGDVCWDAVEDVENVGDAVQGKGRVWGHKAIVYARAPKAFKDRYFPPTSFNRPFASPSPIGNSPYGGAQQPAQSSTSLLMPTANQSHFKKTNRSNSALSGVSDVGTVAASQYGPDGTLRLTHGGTPEMFRAQLEWLYTSEGMGDVVEWISDQDDVGHGFLGPSEVFSGNLRDSRGRKGGLEDRREKLGQDLTYMWRSKLYTDVQIHLITNELRVKPSKPSDSSTSLPNESDYDSSSSTASLSNTASFSSHRFILCSRSPYFASVLLNKSDFRPRQRKESTASITSVEVITLPSPPFTPAALHFCLGYLYNGSLSFSNRTFDLTTAFQIHRCASYLQLDALRDEIEARIVWDFCHGLDHGRCDCRRCAARAPRVWRFACAPDVAAIKLGLLARQWVVQGWGDCWGKEVGEISQVERESIVHDVLQDLKPRYVVTVFRGLLKTRGRLEARALTAGGAPDWEVNLGKMLDALEARAVSIVMSHFKEVAESAEMFELLNEKSFDSDVLATILDVVENKSGRPEWCGEIGKVYQTLVSSLLLRENPQTKQTVLMMGSKTRQMVEDTREAVIAHTKRRWMLARDQHAFVSLENWALKEISDEIEVSVDDLLAVSSTVPRPKFKPRPGVMHTTPPRLRASASSRTESLASDASSIRSVATSRSRVSLAPSQISSTSTLRLHSSPPRTGAADKTTSIASRLTQAPNAVASSSRLRAVTTPTPSQTAHDPTATGLLKGKGRASDTSAAAPSVSGQSRVVNSPAIAAPTSGSVSDVKGKARASDVVSARSTINSRARAPSVTSTRTTATSVSTSSKVRPPTAAVPRAAAAVKPPSLAPARSAVQLVKPAELSPRAANHRPPSVKSMAPAPSRSIPKTSIPRPASSRSIRQPTTGSTKSVEIPTAQNTRVPVKASQPQTLGTSAERPSSVNSVRSTKSNKSTTSTSSKAKGVPPSLKPAPPMPKDARNAIATHRSPSSTSLATSPSGMPRLRAVSTNSRLTPAPTTSNAPGTKVSAVTAARLRTASLASNANANKPRPSGLSDTYRAPATSRSKVSAVASQFGGQPSVRSPSSSTDNTEMQTPTLSEAKLEPPTIIQTTSTGSELADLVAELEEVKIAPIPPKANQVLSPSPVISSPPPRNVRTNSTSSVVTNASARPRYHPAAAFDPPRSEQSLPLPTVRVDDGLKPLPVSHGVALDIGIPCIVSLREKRARFKAFARYIGRIEGCRGAWVGVEVDEASRDKFGLDTSDGSQEGTRYFHLSSPNLGDVSDPLERANRRRKIEAISTDLMETGLTKKKMAGLGLGTSLFPQASSPSRGPRGSLTRSSSPFGERMSTDPWGQNWLGEAQPCGLFVRPSEVVFVEGAE